MFVGKHNKFTAVPLKGYAHTPEESIAFMQIHAFNSKIPADSIIPYEDGASAWGIAPMFDITISDLTVENCTSGDNLVFNIRVGTRKISKSILREKLSDAVFEYMKQHNVEYVTKSVRKELKEALIDSMIHSTPVSYRNIAVAITEGEQNKVYAVVETASGSDMDLVSKVLMDVFAIEVEQEAFPDTKKVGENWANKAFNYLFMKTETDKEINYTTEPPYSFLAISEDAECDKLMVSGELSQSSKEVGTALKMNKVLTKVNLNVVGIVGTEDEWKFTVDGALHFAKVTFPENDSMDAKEVLSQHITDALTAHTWVKGRFEEFISNYNSKYEEEYKNWVNNR